ncbi:polymer-forming cytoskeletal protein [Patescibacteria group bacterium]|nr:polymer-forming cytoskeletal protein [Patescibacteria group bacterium]MBU1075317.1 polymer-forming cytoskeletal protein [Patescibacteria group bacterium]MBU1951543.1 polymer-forming cytoskeletal protein [Patescibacteria group bacterium]
MFKNQEGEITEKETETIIGPSVKVEGDFHGEGSIVVEGQVIGTLKTNQDLRIGPNAKVKADVEAANVLIAGEVVGDLYIKEKVELKNSAKVIGDITTKIISIEAGASLNGKCVCDQNASTERKEETSKPKLRNGKTSKPEVL